MKKLLFALMFVTLFIPRVSHAAEAVFGFGDGKYYDVTGSLKYFCFLDGNCFSMDGQPVDMKAVLDNIPMPSYTDAVYKPYPDTPTPQVFNPNQSLTQPTTMETSQPAETSVTPQDTSLIVCGPVNSNCQISVGKNYVSILLKTSPDATVTATLDGLTTEPRVEQGLATKGLKFTTFSFEGLSGSEHSYSIRVETANAWDVEDGTITLK